MRVAVVGLRGIPGVMGGVETHCEEMFPRLRKLRPHDDFTVLMRRAYAPSSGSDFGGLSLVSLPHLRGKNWEAISSTVCGIFYSRFRLKADVLHIQGIGPALLAPLARLLGQSVIVTYHSRNYDHAKWSRIGRWALRLGELNALLFANRVVVIADWLGRDVRERYPAFAAKVRVVPNGADHLANETANTGAARTIMERHGLQPNAFTICVGRLVPEKGFDVIVDALARMPHAAKLVICGGADHADAYSRKLLERASDRVIFTGALERSTLSALLAQASLFVLPSYHEGLPIAALEAARAGVPILLSEIDANRDLHLPPDCYFKAGDVAGLAVKLSQPPETYRIEADRLLSRFAWDTSAETLNAVYEDMRPRETWAAALRRRLLPRPSAPLSEVGAIAQPEAGG